MQSSTLTPLTSAEAASVVGGSCGETVKAIGYIVGTAFHFLSVFGSGAAEFDWSTMK